MGRFGLNRVADIGGSLFGDRAVKSGSSRVCNWNIMSVSASKASHRNGKAFIANKRITQKLVCPGNIVNTIVRRVCTLKDL